MDVRQTLTFALIGAAGGVLAGLAVSAYASRTLDEKMREGSAQLTTQFGAGREEMRRSLASGRQELERLVRERVQAEVPPRVDQQIRATFRQYNITPDTGRQVARLLALAERSGLLGVGVSRLVVSRVS